MLSGFAVQDILTADIDPAVGAVAAPGARRASRRLGQPAPGGDGITADDERPARAGWVLWEGNLLRHWAAANFVVSIIIVEQGVDPSSGRIRSSWKLAIIVVRIHRPNRAPLFQIRLANHPPGLLFDALQRGHQYRQQKGDDRDNNQKLDQCKSSFRAHSYFPSRSQKGH